MITTLENIVLALVYIGCIVGAVMLMVVFIYIIICFYSEINEERRRHGRK